MTDQEREWIRLEFSRCAPWIQAALDRYPLRTHELEHVLADLESGKAQIWPTPTSVCVTLIDTYPTGLKVLVGWLAGGELQAIKQTIPYIEKFAVAAGCKATIIINARPGWVRAFEAYREVGRTIYKEVA